MIRHNRNAARFTAPDEFYIIYDGARIDALEFSETGMRLPDEGGIFVAGGLFDCTLIIHDEHRRDGWTLKADCVWTRDHQAGFRFHAEAAFRRTIFERLLHLRHRGRTKVISGTEF